MHKVPPRQWKDEERIVAAAIKGKNGNLYIGARHTHCFTLMALDIKNNPELKGYHPHPETDQGFITADGRFLDRNEAYKLAVETSQTNSRFTPMSPADNMPILFSEDLR